MANKFTEESAEALVKASQSLAETVEELKKSAVGFAEEVKPLGMGVVDENCEALVNLVNSAMAPTFLSGAETIERTAKATLSVLAATKNK